MKKPPRDVKRTLRTLIDQRMEQLRWERLSEQEKERILLERKREQDRAKRREQRKRRAAEREAIERSQRALTEKIERKRRALIKRIRSVLSEIKAAAPNFIRIAERDHMYFRAIVSVVGQPVEAEITLGNSGGRVAPGPRFDKHSRLLEYLRTEFVTYVAGLVAESKLAPDSEQVDADDESYDVDDEEEDGRLAVTASGDEVDDIDDIDDFDDFDSDSDDDDEAGDDDDGEDPFSCAGSFSIVLKRDVSDGYIVCPHCGAYFSPQDLHEVDDQDGELRPPRYPAILGSLPRHIPREVQLEAS